jgi:hypothetical protein
MNSAGRRQFTFPGAAKVLVDSTVSYCVLRCPRPLPPPLATAPCPRPLTRTHEPRRLSSTLRDNTLAVPWQARADGAGVSLSPDILIPRADPPKRRIVREKHGSLSRSRPVFFPHCPRLSPAVVVPIGEFPSSRESATRRH